MVLGGDEEAGHLLHAPHLRHGEEGDPVEDDGGAALCQQDPKILERVKYCLANLLSIIPEVHTCELLDLLPSNAMDPSQGLERDLD